MAEEQNSTDEFSSFDDMNLENSLTDQPSSPKNADDSANKTESPEQNKPDEDLENFFDDLSQLEKEPTNKAPAEENPELPVAAASTMLNKKAKRSLKMPKLNLKFGKFFKTIGLYIFFIAIIGTIFYGGYYLYENFASTAIQQISSLFNSEDNLIPDIEIEDIVENNIDVLAPKNDILSSNISKDGSWKIQLASCTTQACVNKIQDALYRKKISENYYHIEKRTITTYFNKIYAANTYINITQLDNTIDKINQLNTFGLNAYNEKTTTGYRLVLGLIPTNNYGIQGYLEAVRSEMKRMLPEVSWENEFYTANNSFTKVLLGPFATREKAQLVLDTLQSTSGFQQAFLTNN